MAIFVEEGLMPNGTDLVMPAKLPEYVDESEYRAGGGRGLETRSSRDGVFVASMGRRMLGHEQARAMGEALLRAAKHAEERGAPAVLMDTVFTDDQERVDG